MSTSKSYPGLTGASHILSRVVTEARVSLRSNSKVSSVAHGRQHCENFVRTDADSPVTMESQSRSEARASLQVDFEVLPRAHASLRVDSKVLSGAHVSLQVDFKVLSGAHVSLQSTSKFDPG